MYNGGIYQEEYRGKISDFLSEVVLMLSDIDISGVNWITGTNICLTYTTGYYGNMGCIYLTHVP